ncbi:MAG: GAF domain-containing protein [Nevskiaceae bacterium]|nr:MAG: GAF domain-containing protein [Nevskiaceae bacterium]
MDRQILALDTDSPKVGDARVRKTAPARRSSPSRAQYSGQAGRIIQDILQSAADVLDADQAYVLTASDDASTETVAALSSVTARTAQQALKRAAPAIRNALLQRRATAADRLGQELPLRAGQRTDDIPAMLCLPLDAHPRSGGVMCLIRRRNARQITALDLEIVQALADQAALALAAASHQRALSRLEASLSGPLPVAG